MIVNSTVQSQKTILKEVQVKTHFKHAQRSLHREKVQPLESFPKENKKQKDIIKSIKTTQASKANFGYSKKSREIEEKERVNEQAKPKIKKSNTVQGQPQQKSMKQQIAPLAKYGSPHSPKRQSFLMCKFSDQKLKAPTQCQIITSQNHKQSDVDAMCIDLSQITSKYGQTTKENLDLDQIAATRQEIQQNSYSLTKSAQSQSQKLRKRERIASDHSSTEKELTKLDSKVAWFYKKVCSELKQPINFYFLNKVIPLTFKTDQAFKKEHNIENNGTLVIDTFQMNENHMLSICQTLKFFERKILGIEIRHLLDKSEIECAYVRENCSVFGSQNQSDIGQKNSLVWSLIDLLKSFKHSKQIKITCNPEQSPLVNESQYKSLLDAISRQPNQNYSFHYSKNQYLNNSIRNRNKVKEELQQINFLGAHFRPSFFNFMAKAIDKGRFFAVRSLNLVDCSIQDNEGITLMKAVITARKTPNLQAVSLRKNTLGVKFSQAFIQLLLEAQEIAKQDATKLVNLHGSNGELGNLDIQLDTLDYLNLKKVDLSQNKITGQLQHNVNQLLKGFEEFKEQAKIYQKMFQMEAQYQMRNISLSSGSKTNKEQNFTNYLEKNKMIIEVTHEFSSEHQSNEQEDSFDQKDPSLMFEDFLRDNKSKTRSRSNTKSVDRSKSFSFQESGVLKPIVKKNNVGKLPERKVFDHSLNAFRPLNQEQYNAQRDKNNSPCLEIKSEGSSNINKLSINPEVRLKWQNNTLTTEEEYQADFVNTTEENKSLDNIAKSLQISHIRHNSFDDSSQDSFNPFKKCQRALEYNYKIKKSQKNEFEKDATKKNKFSHQDAQVNIQDMQDSSFSQAAENCVKEFKEASLSHNQTIVLKSFRLNSSKLINNECSKKKEIKFEQTQNREKVMKSQKLRNNSRQCDNFMDPELVKKRTHFKPKINYSEISKIANLGVHHLKNESNTLEKAKQFLEKFEDKTRLTPIQENLSLLTEKKTNSIISSDHSFSLSGEFSQKSLDEFSGLGKFSLDLPQKNIHINQSLKDVRKAYFRKIFDLNKTRSFGNHTGTNHDASQQDKSPHGDFQMLQSSVQQLRSGLSTNKIQFNDRSERFVDENQRRELIKQFSHESLLSRNSCEELTMHIGGTTQLNKIENPTFKKLGINRDDTRMQSQDRKNRQQEQALNNSKTASKIPLIDKESFASSAGTKQCKVNIFKTPVAFQKRIKFQTQVAYQTMNVFTWRNPKSKKNLENDSSSFSTEKERFNVQSLLAQQNIETERSDFNIKFNLSDKKLRVQSFDKEDSNLGKKIKQQHLALIGTKTSSMKNKTQSNKIQLLNDNQKDSGKQKREQIIENEANAQPQDLSQLSTIFNTLSESKILQGTKNKIIRPHKESYAHYQGFSSPIKIRSFNSSDSEFSRSDSGFNPNNRPSCLVNHQEFHKSSFISSEIQELENLQQDVTVIQLQGSINFSINQKRISEKELCASIQQGGHFQVKNPETIDFDDQKVQMSSHKLNNIKEKDDVRIDRQTQDLGLNHKDPKQYGAYKLFTPISKGGTQRKTVLVGFTPKFCNFYTPKTQKIKRQQVNSCLMDSSFSTQLKVMKTAQKTKTLTEPQKSKIVLVNNFKQQKSLNKELTEVDFGKQMQTKDQEFTHMKSFLKSSQNSLIIPKKFNKTEPNQPFQ